jgi:hypothetical protein
MMIPEVVHEHYLKVPVIKREHFTVWFEEHVKGTFIHCEVTKYNASVRRELQETYGLLRWLHGGPIYALHDFSDRKHEKFLRLFGFRPHQCLPNLKQIWIWRNTDG